MCHASKFTQFIEKEYPHSFFFFFISGNFLFYLINALFYVDKDQGIHNVKLKVAQNEKRKKLSVFSLSINIANFEAFCMDKKVDLKPLFSEECMSNLSIHK